MATSGEMQMAQSFVLSRIKLYPGLQRNADELAWLWKIVSRILLFDTQRCPSGESYVRGTSDGRRGRRESVNVPQRRPSPVYGLPARSCRSPFLQ